LTDWIRIVAILHGDSRPAGAFAAKMAARHIASKPRENPLIPI
jgi:hypothetical protein